MLEFPEISALSEEKRALLRDLLRHLTEVPGLAAVVLGGSYARGIQREGSDLDLGLYYHDSRPLDISRVREIARGFSAKGEPVVTGFYEWGAWVNGGAWIHTAAGKVDFIYRSIEHVQRTIDAAHTGKTELDFNQQPPYGFFSVIYLGETHVCKPLYDPDGELAQLKTQVAQYPAALKERSTMSSLWLAEFSLLHADGYAKTGDLYCTAGALTRTAAYLTQALYALNETYFISDKSAMREIANFPLVPAGYGEALSAALAQPGQTPAELAAAVRAVRDLWAQVAALTGGQYRPAFAV